MRYTRANREASSDSSQMSSTRAGGAWLAIAAATMFGFGASAVRMQAQDAAAAQTAQKAPSQAGTVKSAGDGSLVVTNKAGQDVTVTVGAGTKFLIVPPGSTTLSSATSGSLTDAAPGDKALITGKVGDTATSMNAVRVVLMKSGAIEQAHAAQASAWAQGSGGIVKSVDGTGGTVVISSGMKTMTISTTPQTIVRRYANGSVRFEDAVASTVGAIQPGDQLRVRGAKSADGSSIAADEIVTGSFRNYSGVIASIDSTGDTITLKDLATKKTVTVAVPQNSDVRRIPATMAQGIAARMKGGSAAGTGGAPAGGARPAGGSASGPGGPPSSGADGADSGQRRAGRAGMDLSAMLSRLPTETLGGLKVGEAVMIVASSPGGGSSNSTAITLLAGVEPILAAPAGEATTLSPWSMGGGGGEGEGGMGGPAH